MPDFLLRADASITLGTGHVMRLLALAEAVRSSGRTAAFALGRGSAEVVRPMLESRRFSFLESPVESGGVAEARWVAGQGAAAVVSDGYVFGAEYFRELAGTRVVSAVIDDLCEIEIDADVVVNQNFEAETLPYRTAARTRRLLGTAYAMLRPEFLAHPRGSARPGGDPLRVLVTFGGADHTGSTARVARILVELGAEVIAVVGAAYAGPRIESGTRLRVERAVPDMAALMLDADAAVSAAGTTQFELSWLAVPSAFFCVAENQRRAAEALGRRGYAVYGGWIERLSDEAVREAVRPLVTDHAARSTLREKFGALVDGRGVERVLAAIDDARRTKA